MLSDTSTKPFIYQQKIRKKSKPPMVLWDLRTLPVVNHPGKSKNNHTQNGFGMKRKAKTQSEGPEPAVWTDERVAELKRLLKEEHLTQKKIAEHLQMTEG